MDQITCATPSKNSAPPETPAVTVRPVLRGPNLDVARIAPRDGFGTSPTKPLGPKPAPPVQALTARPLARDPWDAHHADLAFSEPVGGAA